MLRLDIRRPELAGFVACKENDAPCFLRIAFKHNALPLTFLVEKNCCPLDLPNPTPGVYLRSIAMLSLHYAIKGPQNPSTETILQIFDHVTEGTVAYGFHIAGHMSQLLALCHTNLALPSKYRG